MFGVRKKSLILLKAAFLFYFFIKNTAKSVKLRHLLHFEIPFFLFESVIYSYDGKNEFSASLLKSSESHDPSEIILIYGFDAQETFHIIHIENGLNNISKEKLSPNF